MTDNIRNTSMFEAPNKNSNIKKIYAVMSGKGGVGKSLTTSLLASGMNKKGFKVGILDGDVTGPSIPKGFNLKGPAMATNEGTFPVETDSGIKVMSTNILLNNETDAVLWRAPIINQMIKTFWTNINWGDLDYLFIDMPPGTGDVPLTVFQTIPIDGVIIVTSPQNLVTMIVEKSLNMAKSMDIPIMGIVENMSYFKCPSCGEKHSVFGESNIEEVSKNLGTEVVAKLPIDPEISKKVDSGRVEEIDSVFYLNYLLEKLM